MMKSNLAGICVALMSIVVSVAGCTKKTDTSDSSKQQNVPGNAPELAAQRLLPGGWIRNVRGGDGREGMSIGPRGELSFINVYSMSGMDWRLDGDVLVLRSNTERQPEPFESRYRIASLTETSLTLESEADYLAGTYTRLDLGHVSGTVSCGEKETIPVGAVVRLRLDDVTSATAPRLIGHRVLHAGGVAPITFDIAYDPGMIVQNGRYEVSADISENSNVLFSTAAPIRVITGGNPVVVQAVLTRTGAAKVKKTQTPVPEPAKQALAKTAPAPVATTNRVAPKDIDPRSGQPTRFQFAAGTTAGQIQGSVTGHASKDYVLRARGGQTMTVTLTSSNSAATFFIYDPAGELLVNGTTLASPAWSSRLVYTGDYRIQVLLNKPAAVGDESASYQLHVEIPPK